MIRTSATRTTALMAILALISTPVLAAKVYKYTDSNGNLVFTDEPVKGAEELDVQPVPTIPALVPQPKPADAGAPADSSGPFAYSKMTIILPSDGEHFVNNGGTVSVQVALSPALRKTDKLQLYFNGNPQGEPQRATTFNLSNLDRGEYSAQVAAINNQGKEIGRSDSVTFYIRRSAASPKPTPR